MKKKMHLLILEKAGRTDLADSYKSAEIEILNRYLPGRLSEEKRF